MFAYERIRNMIHELDRGSEVTPDQVRSEIQKARDLTSTEKEELSSLLVE